MVKKIFLEIGSVNFAEMLSDDTLNDCGLILENHISKQNLEKNTTISSCQNHCSWVAKIVIFGGKGGPVEARECRRWIRRAILSQIPF